MPKKTGYFVDKTDFQKPATVLGYAHMYVYSSLIFYHEVSYLLSFIYFLEYFEILSFYNFTVLERRDVQIGWTCNKILFSSLHYFTNQSVSLL
jgi:hypothetical protein